VGYDADVIIIGGGPAGMSAAIRARWVKRYKAIVCSTLVIENATLGGLASWQGCSFTGPGWKIPRGDIVSRLDGDLNALHIPVHYGRVVRVDTQGVLKRVYTADGNVFTSLAVVVATGIKALTNEKAFYGKGLDVTSMGYEYMVEHLTSLLARKWEPRLIVVGSPKLYNLIPLIRQLNQRPDAGGSEVLFVIEGSHEAALETDIVCGWVERYTGSNALEGIILHTSTGQKEIPCGGVLLDFNSYEIAPQRRMDFTSDILGEYFIQVDANMRTTVPGILAAGDVTAGGYNSFSRAVSQGVIAGLSIYEDIFIKKFGQPPPLFAYRPSDFELHADFQELPRIGDRMIPVALSPADEIQKAHPPADRGLIDCLDGHKSIEEIGHTAKMPLAKLKETLVTLAEKKLITFHIEVS